MAVSPPAAVLGIKAPDFTLPGTDGKTYRLADIRGKKGTVVVFICNHCPYVKGVIGRLIADARLLIAEGVNFVAINSNDVVAFPEDGPDGMRAEAAAAGYTFPYLFDETQEVAKAFRAACTPDLYLFDRNRTLVYRGRFDESDHVPPRKIVAAAEATKYVPRELEVLRRIHSPSPVVAVRR